MKQDISNSDKPRRVLKILKYLSVYISAGVNEIVKALEDEFPNTSLRTIQRDLALLRDEEYIKLVKNGRETNWVINKKYFNAQNPAHIPGNELLSFYMLKAYLNTFHGTSIEADINHLTNRLEALAPGNPLIKEDTYWDQNFGNYDYHTHNQIIENILNHIRSANLITMTYKKPNEENEREYLIVPKALYTYRGTLYLVAYDFKKNEFRNYIIQNIVRMSIAEENSYTDVAHINLTKSEFKQHRFAVYDGDPKDVRLRVKKEYSHYFTNRRWHPSQDLHKSRHTGELIIELKVPESLDFISWIMSWGDIITIESPSSLVVKVKEKLEATLANYGNQNK